MKSYYIIIALAVATFSCRSAMEKQEVNPILAATQSELRAVVTFKDGTQKEFTGTLPNIKKDDILKVDAITPNTSHIIFFNRKDNTRGNIILEDNSKRKKADLSKVLIVLNGVTKDKGFDLDSVSPDDIEALTVLKGDSFKALYNFPEFESAILITTKSGK